MDNKKKGRAEKKEDKKHLAKILYIDLGISQTEIAKRLDTNQPQINRWVKDGEWDAIRAGNRVTPKQLALQLYKRIYEINILVEEEKRPITMSETDTISKLNACIRDLDKSADFPTFLQAFEEFTEFMQSQDEAISKALPDYIYAFLTKKAKDLSNG